MSSLTNPDLIRYVVCPDCGAQLGEFESCLSCSSCFREYEIRNGIPLLYPKNLDTDHLREEENLARMMKSPRLTAKEEFSLSQWTMSKGEFWSMVQTNVSNSPSTLINIGCGYDEGFKAIEQAGHTFINFDLIYDMLYRQQKDAGAKSCVCGDINSLPFRKGEFDAVISIDVIHHETNDLENLLRSFRDLLKPGGRLLLEDPNAWGLFQLSKSIVLPRPIYRYLRSMYHRLKKSVHRPADYEFPTDVWRVRRMLEELGFQDVKIYAHTAYPCISQASYRFYKLLSRFEFVRKYHNYHYMLSAVRR